MNKCCECIGRRHGVNIELEVYDLLTDNVVFGIISASRIQLPIELIHLQLAGEFCDGVDNDCNGVVLAD